MGAGRVITSCSIKFLVIYRYIFPSVLLLFFSRARPQVCVPDGKRRK